MGAADDERYDPAVHGERRAAEPLLYTPDQLVGRRPIRLRRASDRRRLAAHVLAVAILGSLTAWWIVPAHGFAGPVLVTLTRGHGVHVGDLPSLLFVAVAGRSLVAAGRLSLSRP